MSNPSTSSCGTVTPYLLVEGARQLVDFCVAAFDGTVAGMLTRPDGSLMHAEIELGENRVMMGEPMGEFDPMPGAIFLRVEDCDAVYTQALAAGGTSIMEVTTMHHAGERYGGVRDPFGNVWWVSTKVEGVPWAEQQRRIDALAELDLGR